MTKPKPKKKKASPPTKAKLPIKAAASRGNGGKPADEGSVPKSHNKGVRKDIILKAIRKIKALEKDRDAINEDIRSIKMKEIKGDLGMKIADFNAALRLYDLENEDRAEFFDTLRETFEAVGIGKQLDFLDEMEKQDKRAAEHTVHDPAPAGE